VSQEWKVIPVEPTTEMRDAINGLLAAHDDGSDVTPSYFMKMLINACPTPTAVTENTIAGDIQAALDYSRSFATAKPNIGLTEKEHIEGLANLLERTALENSRLQLRHAQGDDAKCYRLDPAISAVTDLVTDEQMHGAFQGTNFGHDDFRGLLAQGCIKALAGWHQGHTLTTILDELRLIAWDKQTDRIKVTAKGHHYIWLAFKGRPGV
jgi:hypothetical protein